MSLCFAAGSETTELSPVEIKAGLSKALDALGQRNKVLCLPPDYTRFHSHAGPLTRSRSGP